MAQTHTHTHINAKTLSNVAFIKLLIFALIVTNDFCCFLLLLEATFKCISCGCSDDKVHCTTDDGCWLDAFNLPHTKHMYVLVDVVVVYIVVAVVVATCHNLTTNYCTALQCNMPPTMLRATPSAIFRYVHIHMYVCICVCVAALSKQLVL